MGAVFAGIAVGHGGGTATIGLALLALMCATLQASVFSYYHVRYRAESGGDMTSRVNESESAGYAWDDARTLSVLHTLYTIIFAWQDALMDWMDRKLVRSVRPLRREFLTATSVLGLGTQLLIIAVYAFFGRPGWALWLFPTVFNGYWLFLLIVRRYTK